MSETAKIVLLGAELLTILSAFAVTLYPNILYASVALLFCFLGVAVMFLFAGADFLAGAQVIVYVGGVTILILFAIMLTHWLYQVRLKDLRRNLIVPTIVCALGLLPFLYRATQQLARQIESTPPQNLQAFQVAPKTAIIGEALLNQYLLPFEAITILLLGALVGAVWIARPR